MIKNVFVRIGNFFVSIWEAIVSIGEFFADFFTVLGQVFIEIVTDNEEAELLCTVKNEVLWGYNEQEFCKQVTLSNKDVKQTWWYKRSVDVFSCDCVDIVAKEGEHIVGYAVIKIEPTDFWYKADIVKSVCFPQWFGEYQNISEEYVQGCIGQAKE